MSFTVVHQQNTKLFDSITVSGNDKSKPIIINSYSLYAIQHVWSGTSGAFQIIVEGSNFDTTDDDYFTVIDITNVTAANSPKGNRLVNVEKAGYAYVRVRISFASGGGTLTSVLNGKVL